MNHSQDMMTANVNELKEFAAVYRTNDCIPTARKINNIDGFAQKAISLGNTLVFRKLIYEGLGVASKKLIPMIYKSVENLFNLYERNIYMTDALTNGDYAAQSIGIDIGTADITFIGMAKPIADADPSLWSLLPFMFAATIFSTALTTSVFKPSIDGSFSLSSISLPLFFSLIFFNLIYQPIFSLVKLPLTTNPFHLSLFISFFYHSTRDFETNL